MTDEPLAVTQAEFARMEGKARSYITALKGAGRLVMTADGKVDVEASRARIAGTGDPNRDDVAQRWAEQRPSSTVHPENADNSKDKIGNSYQAARAVKEKFSALQAKLEYERAIEKVVEISDVDRRVEDRFMMFRQALENMPNRTAPELVGKDLDAIRGTLKQEIHNALLDLESSLKKIAKFGDDS